VTSAWVSMMKKLELQGVRLHDLRHSHASQLLKQGIHPKNSPGAIRPLQLVVTLDTYSHIAPGLQRAAAERFDEVMNGWSEYTANEKIR
jgi:integrase